EYLRAILAINDLTRSLDKSPSRAGELLTQAKAQRQDLEPLASRLRGDIPETDELKSLREMLAPRVKLLQVSLDDLVYKYQFLLDSKQSIPGIHPDYQSIELESLNLPKEERAVYEALKEFSARPERPIRYGLACIWARDALVRSLLDKEARKISAEFLRLA